MSTSPATELAGLVDRLRGLVDGRAGTADRVAASFRACTPTAGVLTAAHREGDPDRLASWVLHAEEPFSVVAISLRIYGTDVRVTGSSVRRTSDLPVLEPSKTNQSATRRTR